jgi:hypothetical protein
MIKPTIQIGDEVREMTDKEIVQYEKDQADFAEWAQVEADRQALKQKTLAKLGLSADEIASLLS